MKNYYQEYLSFVKELAKAPAEIIISHFKNITAEHKADGSEVTEADRKAEQVIREKIITKYPSHKIIGEEFGTQNSSDSEFTWVIDPLDGTTWYSFGVPIFGTLIALLNGEEIIAGAIHFPMVNESLYAVKELGCWWEQRNNKPKLVVVSDDKSITLKNARVSASGVHKSDISPHHGSSNINLSRIINGSGKFRFCGDCLQHSLVAQGFLHSAIDTIMMPWDTAAIIPCIKEAGGVVSDISGKTENLINSGSLVSSSNEKLHNEIIGLLNN